MLDNLVSRNETVQGVQVLKKFLAAVWEATVEYLPPTQADQMGANPFGQDAQADEVNVSLAPESREITALHKAMRWLTDPRVELAVAKSYQLELAQNAINHFTDAADALQADDHRRPVIALALIKCVFNVRAIDWLTGSQFSVRNGSLADRQVKALAKFWDAATVLAVNVNGEKDARKKKLRALLDLSFQLSAADDTERIQTTPFSINVSAKDLAANHRAEDHVAMLKAHFGITVDCKGGLAQVAKLADVKTFHRLMAWSAAYTINFGFTDEGGRWRTAADNYNNSGTSYYAALVEVVGPRSFFPSVGCVDGVCGAQVVEAYASVRDYCQTLIIAPGDGRVPKHVQDMLLVLKHGGELHCLNVVFRAWVDAHVPAKKPKTEVLQQLTSRPFHPPTLRSKSPPLPFRQFIRHLDMQGYAQSAVATACNLGRANLSPIELDFLLSPRMVLWAVQQTVDSATTLTAEGMVSTQSAAFSSLVDNQAQLLGENGLASQDVLMAMCDGMGDTDAGGDLQRGFGTDIVAMVGSNSAWKAWDVVLALTTRPDLGIAFVTLAYASRFEIAAFAHINTALRHHHVSVQNLPVPGRKEIAFFMELSRAAKVLDLMTVEGAMDTEYASVQRSWTDAPHGDRSCFLFFAVVFLHPTDVCKLINLSFASPMPARCGEGDAHTAALPHCARNFREVPMDTGLDNDGHDAGASGELVPPPLEGWDFGFGARYDPSADDNMDVEDTDEYNRTWQAWRTPHTQSSENLPTATPNYGPVVDDEFVDLFLTHRGTQTEYDVPQSMRKIDRSDPFEHQNATGPHRSIDAKEVGAVSEHGLACLDATRSRATNFASTSAAKRHRVDESIPDRDVKATGKELAKALRAHAELDAELAAEKAARVIAEQVFETENSSLVQQVEDAQRLAEEHDKMLNALRDEQADLKRTLATKEEHLQHVLDLQGEIQGMDLGLGNTDHPETLVAEANTGGSSERARLVSRARQRRRTRHARSKTPYEGEYQQDKHDKAQIMFKERCDAQKAQTQLALAQVTEAQSEVARLHEQLATQELQAQTLTQQVDAANEKARVATDELAQKRAEAEAASDTVESQTAMIDSMGEKNTAREAAALTKIQEAESNAGELRKSLETTKADALAIQAQMAETKTQLEKKRHDAEEAEKYAKLQETKIASLQEAQSSVAAQEEKLKELELAATRAEEKSVVTQAACDAANTERLKLNNDVAAMEKNLKLLQEASTEKLSELTAALGSKTAELSAAQESFQRLELESSTLREHSTAQSGQIDQLKATLEGKDAQTAKLQEQIGTTENNLNLLHEKANEKLSELTAALGSKTAELSAAQENFRRLELEGSALEGRATAQSGQIDQLKAALESRRAQSEGKEAQIAKLLEQIETTEKAEAQTSEELRAAEEKLKVQRKAAEELQSKVDALKDVLEKHQETIAEKDVDLGTVKEAAINHHQDLKARVLREDSLNETLRTTEEDLRTTKEELRKMAYTCEESEAKHKHAVESLENADRARQEARENLHEERVRALEGEKADLEDQLSQAEANLKESERQLEVSTARLDEKTQAYDDNAAKIMAQGATITELRENLAEHEAAVGALNIAMAAATDASASKDRNNSIAFAALELQLATSKKERDVATASVAAWIASARKTDNKMQTSFATTNAVINTLQENLHTATLALTVANKKLTAASEEATENAKRAAENLRVTADANKALEKLRESHEEQMASMEHETKQSIQVAKGETETAQHALSMQSKLVSKEKLALAEAKRKHESDLRQTKEATLKTTLEFENQKRVSDQKFEELSKSSEARIEKLEKQMKALDETLGEATQSLAESQTSQKSLTSAKQNFEDARILAEERNEATQIILNDMTAALNAESEGFADTTQDTWVQRFKEMVEERRAVCGKLEQQSRDDQQRITELQNAIAERKQVSEAAGKSAASLAKAEAAKKKAAQDEIAKFIRDVEEHVLSTVPEVASDNTMEKATPLLSAANDKFCEAIGKLRGLARESVVTLDSAAYTAMREVFATALALNTQRMAMRRATAAAALTAGGGDGGGGGGGGGPSSDRGRVTRGLRAAARLEATATG